jgi:co-chaperonin GroES (HSP10)
VRTIEPFGPRVYAKLRVPPEQTSGGIILTATRQPAMEAIVGDSNIEGICSGDVVVFIPESGYVINVDGDEFIILNDKEILAVLRG